MPIFFSCGYAICSALFLAGISWSVRGAIVSEGCPFFLIYNMYIFRLKINPQTFYVEQFFQILYCKIYTTLLFSSTSLAHVE